MSIEIQRADPATRRVAVAIVLAATLAGVMLISVTETALARLQRRLDEDASAIDGYVAQVTMSVAIMVVMPVLLASLYFWRLGARVIESGVFPPPGMRLVRDTVVVRDGAARGRGRLLKALALVLAAGAMGLAMVLWRLTTLL